MNVLVLNLPNSRLITRRYMCSYVSPESLLPPLELISLAAIVRTNDSEPLFIDAIADNISEESLTGKIRQILPDIIVTITGFECYEEDIDCIKRLKMQFPDTIFIVFGYYATQFPAETLMHSNADYVILGEPELAFAALLKSIIDKNLYPAEKLNGICYIKNGEFVRLGGSNRIHDIAELPMPAYDLLPKDAYYEPLLKRPYGMIQTTRGCPYQCNYCVKSYGTKTTMLTPEEIIGHIQTLQEHFQVKSIRFIDDTFTTNKKRVIEICKSLIEQNIDIEWACLSRADNLDEEMLVWMKKSGCKRIYMGIESGSQKMLDIYDKKIDKQDSLNRLLKCSNIGIETVGFFMGGHPQESQDDFMESVDFAINAKLNFASFNPLTPYPGTSLFDQNKEFIDFNIYPYKNDWKDQSIHPVLMKRKRIFYRKFYMRPSFIWNNRYIILRSPKRIVSNAYTLISGLMMGKFTIGGLKLKHEK